MNGGDKQARVNRFNRIAGQVRGISQMVAEDRYCIDILHQIQAVRAALARAESEVLKDHARTCVADAVRSGDPDQQAAKFAELIDLIERAKR